MELIIPCFVAVAEQDTDFPTFAEVDCTLLVNEHDDDYFGIMIDCEVDVIRDRVDACLATSKSIRLVVTIDGEDVTNAITGTITINHTLNQISSFSLTLIDSQYSPLINSHIDADVVVTITVFVDGEEFKLFTGLVDTPKTRRTKDFKLEISGRGYGRKLLDKRMTLISVQDSAQNKYRGSVIKYLAGKPGITNVNCSRGDLIITDHSFQDQSIWDMIQKECEIEGWYVRFDEEGSMQVGPKIIKTNKTLYPNPDWFYGEGEFIELGFGKTSKGIINKVIVLGAIFEEEIVTVTPGEITTPSVEIEVPTEEYQEDTTTFENSWAKIQDASGWVDSKDSFTIKSKFLGADVIHAMFIQELTIATYYGFNITKVGNKVIMDTQWNLTGGGATIVSSSNTSCRIKRSVGPMYGEFAFSISVLIKWKELVAGGSTWITENLPAEQAADRIETTYKYTQIKAICQDDASIAKYEERQPQEEYTLNKPLAETEEQCKRVGNNKILDSHQYTKQPDILVNFNPLLVVGQTLELEDTKIGYNGERWIAKQVSHSFSINNETGAITPRTKCGCVFYA